MDYNESVRQDLRFMCHFMMRSMFMGTRNYAMQLQDIADFFFPQERLSALPSEFRRLPSYSGPDCCGSCRTFFGYIRGGRVTDSCHLCQDYRCSRITDDYYNNRIAQRLGISPEWIELSMAEAFNEHTTYLLSSKLEADKSQQQTTTSYLSEEIQAYQADPRN